LPERELRAGYAEIVKYGLLGDATFFEWLEAHGQNVLARDEAAIAYAVQASCRAKADIVTADEREGGVRALLNLGHTFAHAFEAEAGYDGRLLHGEAVGAGIGMAFGFSRHLGLVSGQDEMRVKAHLKALSLPFDRASLPAGNADAIRLIQHMYKDKKTHKGALTFILLNAIGSAFVKRNVDEDSLATFLET
jgi:3-dehydroquinate synthetase